MSAVLPLVFTAGWASGINPYLFALLCGLVGRLGFADMPAGVERTDVLVVLAVLCVVDAVAGKVPYLDSLWDVANTVVRPTAGAAMAVLLSEPTSDLATVAVAAGGGVTALLSHLVKASIRALVNSSPEPASTVAVSVAEDAAVAGVLMLLVLNPWLAAVAAGVLLAGALVLVVVLARLVRRFRRRRQRPDPQQSGFSP